MADGTASSTPPDLVIRYEPRKPESDPTLGIDVAPVSRPGPPEHRLAVRDELQPPEVVGVGISPDRSTNGSGRCDATASYRLAFVLSGACTLVALALAATLRPPRRRPRPTP